MALFCFYVELCRFYVELKSTNNKHVTLKSSTQTVFLCGFIVLLCGIGIALRCFVYRLFFQIVDRLSIAQVHL